MEPGARVGPYVVTARLGAGGMGEVWRARDARLGRDVAIKVLPPNVAADPERLKRFEREARAMAALSHPNVVEIHDVGTHDDAPYLVEELLEGTSLRVRLAEGRLEPREAAAIGAQIARGLAAAHARRIVHRDLKPENIFLVVGGVVKILDFGLAATLAAPAAPSDDTVTEEPTATTVPGRVMGTVAYMAPEQARGISVDHRADIYSLGVVLYEMLAGERPFRGETVTDLIASLLKDRPPPLPASVPPHLRGIVARCLEKKPDERFASAHDLALVLQPPQSRDTVVPEDAGRARPRPAAVRRSWRLAGALVLVAGGAAVGWRALDVHSVPPLPLHPRQLTSAPGWEAEPALSPDGTLVAYASDESGNPDIWLIDAHGGNALQLTDDPASDRRPAWFPDGASLIFTSERGGSRAIWRVPRLGGAPLLLVPDAFDGAIAPDGSRIAFARPGPTGDSRIAVAPVSDPSRAFLVTHDGDGLWSHRHPTWSPDGRTLCYADFRDLWLVSAGGGDAHRLTTDQETDMEPVWSRDGQWIYFSSMRGGTTALWRVPSGGGAPERLSLGTGPEREPSLALDLSRIAYSTYVYNLDVVVWDRDSGRRTRLPGVMAEVLPAVAPDSSEVVFSSDRDGEQSLWRQPLEDGMPKGKPIRLTEQAGSEAMGAYSPSGDWIAYFRVDRDEREVWAILRHGGIPVRLTERPGIDISPAFSRDGSRLAFTSDRSGPECIWVAAIQPGMRLGPAQRLTDGPATASLPDWSPDDRHIAYVSGAEVWVVAVDGTSPPRKVTIGARAAVARWDPRTGDLLASGTWGTDVLEIRSVSLRDGASTPLTPPVVVGPAGTRGGVFGVGADGRLLSYQLNETRGDIWLVERTPSE